MYVDFIIFIKNVMSYNVETLDFTIIIKTFDLQYILSFVSPQVFAWYQITQFLLAFDIYFLTWNRIIYYVTLFFMFMFVYLPGFLFVYIILSSL